MGRESLNIIVILVSASKKKEEMPNRCHEHETQSLLFCTPCCVMCYYIDRSCITLLLVMVIWLPPLPPPKNKPSNHHFTHKNLYFSKINISSTCKENSLEISVIELETKLSILSLQCVLIMKANEMHYCCSRRQQN